MTLIRQTIYRLVLVLLLVTASSTNAMAARSSAVDSVRLTEVGDSARIEIVLSCPNRFLDYYPQVETEVLKINLLRMEQCLSLNLPSGRQEVDISGHSTIVELASVEYEARPGDDAVLHIRFDQSVGAVVSQSDDLRRITVIVETGHRLTSTLPVATSSPTTKGINQNISEPGTGAALGDQPLSEARLVALMGEAEAAVLQEDYNRSIQVYTRVLRAAENIHTPQALELLGLSRERNGQKAHAVAEYQRYLEYYPENEGADRVNQRLAGLVTAHKIPKPGEKSRAVTKSPSDWDAYGGISQHYRHDTFKLNGQESINAQSSILTNADLMLRHRGTRIDLSSRVSLGNMLDLLGSDKGPGSQSRLYQGYVEISDQPTNLSARLGRQTMRNNGVLGRFDGLHLDWEFMPGKRFNLMAGYPVDTTADGIQTSRHFFGAAIDFEQIADIVDVSFYYNTQEIDGLKNREAIGTEVRYFDSSKSLVALIDYDIGFNTLNNLIVTGNWNIGGGLTLSASIDHRSSPFLTTRSALIGQPVGSIEELLQIYTSDVIRQLAKDRTGSVDSLRLGVSKKLSERFQLNADMTMTGFDGTIASEGVLATPDQDTQYYFSLNLVGSKLFMDGDTSILGLRHITGMTSSTSTLSLDSRFPLSRKFRINPRFRVSRRNSKMDDSDSWTVSPSLRLLYRIGRRYRLDFEIGSQWVNRNSPNGIGDRTSWFLYVGYRADF